MTVVRCGQIWADNDKRSTGRTLKIVAVGKTHAFAVEVAYNETSRIAAALSGARQTCIRLDRFRPTSNGYRLIQDVEPSR